MSVRHRKEQGSALIVALVFISVFGLVVAYVLSFAELGLKTTGVVRTTRSNLYSADGSIEAAIRKVEQPGHGANDCQPGNSWTAPTVNGVAPVVTCSFAGADPNSKPARAILTTSSSEGGLVEASNSALNIRGGIVSDSTVATAGSNSTIHIKDAGLSAVGTCTRLQDITTDPTPNDIHCSNSGGAGTPIADPGYSPLQSNVPTYQAVPACLAGSWLIDLQPGYYDDAVGLSNLTSGACPNRVLFFHSGFYYFDFNFVAGISSGCGTPCTWTINDKSVNIVGGKELGWSLAAPAKPTIPAPGACRTDTTTPQAQSNEGVQFVFGAESHISLTAGTFEVCAQPNFTNQEISIFGLTTGSSATTSTGTAVPTSNSGVTGEIAFGNPTNAYRIGETPSPLTADAVLPSANPASAAGLTLSGYDPNYGIVPRGSRIGSAILHVAHKDSANLSALTATVTPGDGSAAVPINGSSGGGCNIATSLCINAGAALVENTIDIKALGISTPDKLNNLKVKYEAASAKNKAATESLDGITIVVTYTPPFFEPLRGCLTASPYTGSGTPCALVQTAGNFTNFFTQGTAYTPSAALDVNLPNGSCQVFGRGVISRTLHVGIPPSHSTCFGDLVYTVFIPLDAQYTFLASINGVPKLRAQVSFSSSGQPPTITGWSVL